MIWEGVLQEKLEALGVAVRVQTFSGDSSYPVEYTLIAGDVRTGGEPTLDLAMMDLIGRLLPQEPVLLDCPHCHGAHYPGRGARSIHMNDNRSRCWCRASWQGVA